jgi:hypothetical protein
MTDPDRGAVRVSLPRPILDRDERVSPARHSAAHRAL